MENLPLPTPTGSLWSPAPRPPRAASPTTASTAASSATSSCSASPSAAQRRPQRGCGATRSSWPGSDSWTTPSKSPGMCSHFFWLVPTVSSLQICCRAVIRNYGNLLLSCGRFDEVVEWYDAMKDSPAVLASGAHGIAITACYRFVILNLL